MCNMDYGRRFINCVWSWGLAECLDKMIMYSTFFAVFFLLGASYKLLMVLVEEHLGFLGDNAAADPAMQVNFYSSFCCQHFMDS